jgi:hypothetical protein
MTLSAALANYAAAYKGYAISKGRTANVEVATQYATMDMLNMVKTMKEEHAIQVVQEETEVYTREV